MALLNNLAKVATVTLAFSLIFGLASLFPMFSCDSDGCDSADNDTGSSVGAYSLPSTVSLVLFPICLWVTVLTLCLHYRHTEVSYEVSSNVILLAMPVLLVSICCSILCLLGGDSPLAVQYIGAGIFLVGALCAICSEKVLKTVTAAKEEPTPGEP